MTIAFVRGCTLALVSLLFPSDAAACGGCFNPAVGTPAPVTGHRMAVAISTEGTTLWDQIRYAGSPEDFVWVLPVSGTPAVELADDGFFQALAAATQISLLRPPPPRPCGASCPGGGAPPCLIALGDAGPSVEVHFEGVVGPYETATVGSSDPMALVDWLNAHGYVVPEGLLPMIAAYVATGANFVVLRLAPGAGVDRMTPVRVTSPGLSLTFPLRMVAAGVGTSVELELFVFAEGRMEAANYGNAEVDRAAVTYDWSTSRFSYDDDFESALFAGTGPSTNWVTEFAGPAPIAALAAFRSFVGDTTYSGAPDTAIVTGALDRPYLTRLRTRLPPNELDRDLVLAASDGPDLGTVITVLREVNRAPDCIEGDCAARPTRPGGIAPALVVVLALASGRMLRRRR